MDMWNKDDEFRKEYVKCNVRSTVRRLGTLDGRSLGPDEEPPMLTSYGVERPDRLVSNQSNISSVLQTPILKQEDQTKPVEDIFTDDTNKVKEGEAKSKTEKNEVVKYTLGNGLTAVSGRGINDEIIETEYVPSKEELELSRKAELLRKEEATAKLREQRRLEEKSKALEALERKKRNAEKAQIRAELRAQKEAEQKEKVWIFNFPMQVPKYMILVTWLSMMKVHLICVGTGEEVEKEGKKEGPRSRNS